MRTTLILFDENRLLARLADDTLDPDTGAATLYQTMEGSLVIGTGLAVVETTEIETIENEYAGTVGTLTLQTLRAHDVTAQKERQAFLRQLACRLFSQPFDKAACHPD
jgi:hypothetical protein